MNVFIRDNLGVTGYSDIKAINYVGKNLWSLMDSDLDTFDVKGELIEVNDGDGDM